MAPPPLSPRARDAALVALDRALHHGPPPVAFQPIVNLISGEVHAYEVLGRVPAQGPLDGADAIGPGELLDVAYERNELTALDDAWRRAAIDLIARHHAADSVLFSINVDPRMVDDPRFSPGLVLEPILESRLPPSRFILELTERGCLLSHPGVAKAVEAWTREGFRMALDDVGAGYASLRAMLRLRPRVIKLDMDLVRDIDHDPMRIHLARALSEFGLRSGMQVIAEGIETEGEVFALLRAGVTLGQGYFLNVPTSLPCPPEPHVRLWLREAAAQVERTRFQSIRSATVGSIALDHPSIVPETTGRELEKQFRAAPDALGFPVVDEDQVVVGLVMRERFFSQTAGAFGYSLHANRPVALLMDAHPLRVDADVTIERVSVMATARPTPSTYDLVLLEKDGRYGGVVTVQALLSKTTELELRHARYASPLTGLPGNVIIEHEIRMALDEVETRGRTWFVYADLDHFKPYNDVYGFPAGDEVIRLVAHILDDAFCSGAFARSFLGHVGGDDFVVVASDDGLEQACARAAADFDEKIRDHYAPADYERRQIFAVDRRGSRVAFPIITLSLAVLNSDQVHPRTVPEVGRIAAELKHLAKARNAEAGNSGFVLERRRSRAPSRPPVSSS